MDGNTLAKLFHETYERIAPLYGYRTREASAKPWDEVPEANRSLMVATAAEVITQMELWHRDLLKKYMNNVADCEGVYFLVRTPEDAPWRDKPTTYRTVWTDEEWHALQALRAELDAEASRPAPCQHPEGWGEDTEDADS